MIPEHEKRDVGTLPVSRRAFLGPLLAGLGGMALISNRDRKQPTQAAKPVRMVECRPPGEHGLCVPVFGLKPLFFTPHASLTICRPPGSLAMVGRGSDRLFLLKDGHHYPIERLGDLTGRVIIDSPESALSFVRLYSSPRTYAIFPQDKTPAFANHRIDFVLEVIPYTRLDVDYLYSDSEMLAEFHHVLSVYNDYKGVVKSQTLPFATVTAVPTGFLIRRPLMANPVYNGSDAASDSLPRYFSVEEWVGPLGEYRLEGLTPIEERIASKLPAFWPTGH